MCLVAILLILAAAMTVSVSWLTLMHQAASGATITKDQVTVRESATGVTSLLYQLVFWPTGIVWLVWVYKSYANLNHLGTRQTRRPPHWTVFAWLIPFLNLIEPYRVVRELWLRSAGLNATREPDSGERTPRITVWWALFLISGLPALAVRFLGRRGGTAIVELILANQILEAGTAILAILIVRKIASFQHHALARPDLAEAAS